MHILQHPMDSAVTSGPLDPLDRLEQIVLYLVLLDRWDRLDRLDLEEWIARFLDPSDAMDVME